MPSQHHQGPVILWFRRDLRLADNLALHAAVSSGRPVICIYVRENRDGYAGAFGAAQAWWLHHSLGSLDASLRARNNRLLLFSGDPRFIIESLIEETGVNAVFWNRRYDPEGISTDIAIKSLLGERGVEAKSFPGFLLHEPSKLSTKQGRYYSVFTPFWKALENTLEPLPALPAPESIPGLAEFPESEPLDAWRLLPSQPDWSKGLSETWEAGEKAAIKRLTEFLTGSIHGYRQNRDFPAKTATSQLSPHLAMGEISPHRIWRTIAAADSIPAEDAASFRREIAWRDFAWHLLFHRPEMPNTSLDRRFDDFPWRSDKIGMRAWQLGQTGYPIVDAGMRELWQTGSMHNRVRMIVASFLIKDLLIDWREGERWFADTLVDADPANNAMNWQWVAGCGADAAPYFRIFNPVKQGETFDPHGSYVRTYCPELAALTDKSIHRPFEAPEQELAKAGIILGKTYPAPLIDHAKARARALDAFKSRPRD
jgi:deoxyribodipyrimidine photo-lyase